MLLRVLFSLLLLFVVFYHQGSYAEVMDDALGPVSDLLIDNNGIYFFETDVTLQSPTWLHDTKIAFHYENQTKLLTNERFIYPTELNQAGDYLFFAVLSDTCIGQITCDFQNVVMMSKNDGSFLILGADFKSAVHLAMEGNNLYVSESNGKIWKLNLDRASKELIYSGDFIIMDMAVHDGNVYWIEEIADQENRVMQINENTKAVVVDDELHIPYGLKITFGKPTWNDIQVKPSLGSINDFTIVKIVADEVETAAEFKNTSPVAMSQSEPHYKPYFVYGDYIVLANNTLDSPVVQLLNYKDDKVLDLATIKDYEIRYFRSDHQNLYIVGQNENGFLIERLAYPVTVPEFGPVIIMLVISLFAVLGLTRRFLPLVRLS